MPRTRAKILVHLIYSTKNRERLIPDDIRDQLHVFLVETLQELRARPILINSVDNHIHILYAHARKHQIARIAEALKRRCSNWMETKGRGHLVFDWQRGSKGLLVRKSRLGAAVEYVLRQNQPRPTFQQTCRNFLARYGLACEKREHLPFKTGSSYQPGRE